MHKILNGNNGKRPIVISASKIATALVVVLLGLGTWGLKEVSSMSKNFASKEMVLDIKKNIDEYLVSIKTEAKVERDCIKEEAKGERGEIKEEAREEREKIENRLVKRIDRLEDTIFSKLDHIQVLLEQRKVEIAPTH
jgi:hypothetical protein